MPNDFDVVVLGGGAAGCAAALSAAQTHARVCLIIGQPGATALFSGAWRGPCPDGLRGDLADVGYELLACEQPLPHPSGTLVPCSLAPPAHAAAQISGRVLIIGIAGLPGFNASALARSWSLDMDASIAADTITVADTPAAGWAYASLAACIERNAQLLIDPVGTRRVDRLILPPVLGVQHHNSLHAQLQEATGCMIGEALAVPPSLPGWRLHHALLQAIERAGISIVHSKAIAAAHARGHVDEVELMNGDVVRGSAFVLATGKYAAGGIEANGDFREPAFNCPVWIEHLGELFESADPLILSDPEYEEDQPILRAGVHADAEHRPVDRAGDVVYDNVFVAGSIRVGWDSATCGIGDAAEDGWYAGLKAVNA